MGGGGDHYIFTNSYCINLQRGKEAVMFSGEVWGHRSRGLFSERRHCTDALISAWPHNDGDLNENITRRFYSVFTGDTSILVLFSTGRVFIPLRFI